MIGSKDAQTLQIHCQVRQSKGLGLAIAQLSSLRIEPFRNLAEMEVLFFIHLGTWDVENAASLPLAANPPTIHERFEVCP